MMLKRTAYPAVRFSVSGTILPQVAWIYMIRVLLSKAEKERAVTVKIQVFLTGAYSARLLLEEKLSPQVTDEV